MKMGPVARAQMSLLVNDRGCLGYLTVRNPREEGNLWLCMSRVDGY
jgi:hypothetical protein